ncbi:hypothetical protein [Candidatus Bealeia paramacronuclearis]
MSFGLMITSFQVQAQPYPDSYCCRFWDLSNSNDPQFYEVNGDGLCCNSYKNNLPAGYTCVDTVQTYATPPFGDWCYKLTASPGYSQCPPPQCDNSLPKDLKGFPDANPEKKDHKTPDTR